MKRKYIILAAISILVVAVVAMVIRAQRNDHNIEKTDEYGGFINYDPPTDEEKAAGDTQKQQIDAEQKQNDTQSNNDLRKNVSVIITDATQYAEDIEVRAFIPDYFQDGTCVIKFTKDNLRLTKSTTAYRDVSGTICTNPEIKRSEFSVAGEWQVTVSFDSKDAEGVSDPQKIIIN